MALAPGRGNSVGPVARARRAATSASACSAQPAGDLGGCRSTRRPNKRTCAAKERDHMVKPQCASLPGFGSPLENSLIGVGIVFFVVGFFSHTGRSRRDLDSLFHWQSAGPIPSLWRSTSRLRLRCLPQADEFSNRANAFTLGGGSSCQTPECHQRRICEPGLTIL